MTKFARDARPCKDVPVSTVGPAEEAVAAHCGHVRTPWTSAPGAEQPLAISRSGEWLVVQRRGGPGQCREATNNWGLQLVPVLVVADNAAERDRIVLELAERIETARGRTDAPRSAGIVAVAELLVDKEAHRVHVDGEEINLTSLEFKLLATLAERADRVQSRATLLGDVWGMSAKSTTRTVDTHVKRLRDKMRSAGRLIQAVRGVGYRLSEKPAVKPPSERADRVDADDEAPRSTPDAVVGLQVTSAAAHKPASTPSSPRPVNASHSSRAQSGGAVSAAFLR